MVSASCVVGPFANSTIIFVFSLSAFSFVITFPRALGARISHSSSKISLFDSLVELGKPITVLFVFLYSKTSSGSNPSLLKIPPFESETAIILHLSSCNNFAKLNPAFP